MGLCFLFVCGIVVSVINSAAATGNWNTWGAWGVCSVTCGNGKMTRTRTCDTPNTCLGATSEQTPCGYSPCEVIWGEWSEWGECSLECGGGDQTRTRMCEGGDTCTGSATDTQGCNTHACSVTSNWGNWGDWSNCSVECGGGMMERSRVCDNGNLCDGHDTDMENCNLDLCNDSALVDGAWTPWSWWSDCSVSCGTGDQVRTRNCTNPLPANGGADCAGDDIESMSCDLGQCSVDGAWSWWSAWSTCTEDCGGGTRSRQRTCDNPAPVAGGAECPSSSGLYDESTPGTQVHEQDCNTQDCQAIDGQWGDWTSVGTCSVTCGGGTHTRVRYCDKPPPSGGGRACPGADLGNPNQNTEEIACNQQDCPVHGSWGEWGNYTECSTTCGTGEMIRTRACDDPAPQYGGLECQGDSSETTPCENEDICFTDGGWGNWTEWTPCLVTCGGGYQERNRTCDNPAPSGGGMNCTGNDTETQMCNTQDCPPTDGAWSTWEDWQICTKTCGIGSRSRLRFCNNPAPDWGGTECTGEDTQTEQCNTNDCPAYVEDVNGGWTAWAEWTSCDATCGTGKQERDRYCTNPERKGNGQPCNIHYPDVTGELEIKRCYHTNHCPVDGQWSQWSAWGPCTESCSASGERTRLKRCDSPAPAHGGAMCAGADMYYMELFDVEDCTNIGCGGGGNEGSTTTPGPTTTVSSSNITSTCLAVSAGNLAWPMTNVGDISLIPCPGNATGLAVRHCTNNGWGDVDTSGCLTNGITELADSALRMTHNATLRREVMRDFGVKCTAAALLVDGDLVECEQILSYLINQNVLSNPTETDADKKEFIEASLSGVNELTSVALADRWRNIVAGEQNEATSLLTEITEDVEALTQKIAEWLHNTNRRSHCKEYLNIDVCVEKVACDVISYRYPPIPPEPTEPPVHIRGGYETPPSPNISYVNLPVRTVHGSSCTEDTPNKFVSTVLYNTLHELMPDENKRPIKRSGEIFEDFHTPNSKAISVQILSQTGKPTTVIEEPFTIELYYNKSSREPKCSWLNVDNQKNPTYRLYDQTGCRRIDANKNYTVCQCDHMTTFLLLTKVGDDGSWDVEHYDLDKGILAVCVLVIILLTLCIILLLVLGLTSIEPIKVLLNLMIAQLLAHIVILCGGQFAYENMAGCTFVACIQQWTLLTTMAWLLTYVGYVYTQAEELGSTHSARYQLVAFFIAWGFPLFITVITVGLTFDVYAGIKGMCWLSDERYTYFGHILPHSLYALCAGICLIYTDRYLTKKLERQEGSTSSVKEAIGSTEEYSILKSTIIKVGILLILLFVTWIVWGLYILPLMWMPFNLLTIGYIVVVFIARDPEVIRRASKKLEDRKRKSEQRKQAEKMSQEPDWVLKMKATREEMRDKEMMEKRREALLHKQRDRYSGHDDRRNIRI